jgi:hypothetical protein
MPEIITCPSCQRKLQVPEEYSGQTVQCPECKHTFVAGAAVQAPAATSPTADVERVPEWDKPATRPERVREDVGEDEEEERPRRRRRRFEDEEDDERPRRRHRIPHRGGMILTFGILSIVLLAGCGPIFGPMAWLMGNTDLAQIRAGTMEREGEGLTQAGRILGIVATIMWAVMVAVYCLFFTLFGIVGGGRGRF